MPSPATLLIGLALLASPAIGDFLGLSRPAPTNIAGNSSLVRAAWQNASSLLDAYLKQGVNTTATSYLNGSEAVTFSAGVFSLYDPHASTLQYHYASPETKHSTQGTREINNDSIYRAASISKLVTVFLALQVLSEADWTRSLSHIFPELVGGNATDAADRPRWDEITPWLLATQRSGLSNEPPGDGVDLAFEFIVEAANEGKDPISLEARKGYPPYTNREPFLCTNNCTQREFVTNLGTQRPSFDPDTTVSYSDTNFMLLGSVLARLTDRPYDVLYHNTLFAPLEMSSSFMDAPIGTPDFNRCVIAGNDSRFAFPRNVFANPSGGLLTTINDLNKLGKAIIGSTLISEALTRAWMKPATHTSSLTFSVGGPWEIVRYVHPQTQHVTDIYTKLGDYSYYGGMLALIPEYGAGFTFLNAGQTDKRSDVALTLINTFGEALINGLEAQAVAETCRNFAGTYAASSNGTNSTLTLTCEEGVEGLIVHQFISKNHDMLVDELVGAPGFSPRLYSKKTKKVTDGGVVTFQASRFGQRSSYQSAGIGPFQGVYGYNFDFFNYDGARYGLKSLSTFDFKVDQTGHATSVVNSALQLRMARVEG